MNGQDALIEHFCTLAVHFINEMGHDPAVARNNAGTHDDSVAAVYAQLLVTAKSHAGQGAHGLALGSCDDNDQFAVRQIRDA